MRKILVAILLFILALHYKGQAQVPVVRPLQYTVLVERTVSRNSNPCFKYVETQPNLDSYGCTGITPEGQPAYGVYDGWCMVEDESCTSCYLVNDMLSLNFQHNGATVLSAPDIDIHEYAKNETRTYIDTFHIYQAQFGVTGVQTVISDADVYAPYNYPSNPNFSIYCTSIPFATVLPVSGEFIDETYWAISRKFQVMTRVRIVPNLDPTFTLPSHDQVLISATNLPFAYGPVWQYQDTISALTNTWYDIPSSFATTNNDESILKISGFDILGANYFNLLHSTVKIRVRNFLGNAVSEVAPFTLRLSSPHIVSIGVTELNCYERNEGTVHIQFDRALLTGERLNILMYDTLHRTSYSALNLSELAPDNSYTWKNELRSGIYHLTLLGKYAKGIEYDTYIDTRVDTVPLYTALNSVNFTDGFNTTESSNFNALTDYTGYSQATYTGALTHMAFRTLTQPEQIRFIGHVDSMVRCKGAATGVITVAAEGGRYHYKYSLKHQDSTSWSAWTNFDNNNVGFFFLQNPNFLTLQGVKSKVRNLYAGKYLLRIRDEVDCYRKDSAGNEVTYAFTITEPERGITLDLLEVSPITSSDSANGQIKVRISGGTPFITGEIPHQPYDITWKDSATGNDISFTNSVLEVNKRMQSQTGKLPDGVYYLRVYDAYYNAAPGGQAGCYLEMKIPVHKPDPLFVNIESKRQITCFDSADAKLLAKVSGGIPIDSLRYTFKWYKVTGGGNILLPQTDSLLQDVPPGTYQVEVTDKYNNKKTSQSFVLTQPPQMHLTLSSTQSSCYTGNDGTLTVAVTGGTPFANGNYTYEWSTGDRTPTVDSVSGGNYLVIVTDSMYCIARDTVSVTSPVRIIPNMVVQTVTCKGLCDGQIAVTATGGSGIYTWSWNTGPTTPTISNLCPGFYRFTVTDAGGCSETDSVEITVPDTLFVNLGDDRKICVGQTIRLDATASDTAILTYNWQSSNGFTANTPKVSITQPGTYRVAVNNYRGCIVRDTIIVTAIDSVINTDYVVSTQAFINENVTLVNISRPHTDSVRWTIPALGNTIRVIKQNNDKCELIFSDTGRFEVTMRAFYSSGCIEDTTKVINVITKTGQVNTGNQANAYLKAYAVIYPNPNNGTFKVDLKFSEVTKARLRLINTLTNITVNDRVIQGLDEYLLDYNMGLLSNGVYVLVIEAAKGSFVYKVIIAQ